MSDIFFQGGREILQGALVTGPQAFLLSPEFEWQSLINLFFFSKKFFRTVKFATYFLK